MLPQVTELPAKTARASTPLSAEVHQRWGDYTEDEDSYLLAKWLRTGAPLGFAEDIPSVGVFPVVQGPKWEDEALKSLCRGMDDWKNYSSAEEEAEELDKLMDDYVRRGFCHKAKDVAEVEQELGRKPIVNRLGMVTKIKDGIKKCRVIWDMKESQANLSCGQGERIVLPRLLDVAKSAARIYKEQLEPWIAIVDVRDAFMNVPAGRDRFATVAAVPSRTTHEMELVVMDVLVFGSASSPTLWGRYAAWLGRTLAAIVPSAYTQIYVDDPSFVLRGPLERAAEDLAIILLWMNVAGYPIKLEKACGGKEAEWIGARIILDDEKREVQITVPETKIETLLATTNKFINKPVIGSKELRAYAGGLSFVAGLVPHLRPFLSSMWAALSSVGSANDGVHHSGKLVHTRRIKAALYWVRSLLWGAPGPLTRTLTSETIEINAEIVTDACPFGLAGILRINHQPVQYFSEDISTDLEAKFKAKRGQSKYNTLWEALAVLTACRLWLGQLGYGATVRVKTDNLATVSLLVNGKAKSQEMNMIAREFALDLALKEYRLHWVEHIFGVTNVEADALSRLYAPIPKDFPETLKSATRRRVKYTRDFWKVDF